MTSVVAVVAGFSIGLLMTREGRDAPGVYVLGAIVIAALAAGVTLELIA